MFGQAPAPIRSTFQREPDNPAPRVTGHATRNWIVEIENAVTLPRHSFHHHGLDLRQIGKRLNALGAKMVRRAIKHCTDLAMTTRMSFEQYAVYRRIQHRYDDCSITHNHRRVSLGESREGNDGDMRA